MEPSRTAISTADIPDGALPVLPSLPLEATIESDRCCTPSLLGRYAPDAVNGQLRRDDWQNGEVVLDRRGNPYVVGADGSLRSVAREARRTKR